MDLPHDFGCHHNRFEVFQGGKLVIYDTIDVVGKLGVLHRPRAYWLCCIMQSSGYGSRDDGKKDSKPMSTYLNHLFHLSAHSRSLDQRPDRCHCPNNNADRFIICALCIQSSHANLYHSQQMFQVDASRRDINQLIHCPLSSVGCRRANTLGQYQRRRGLVTMRWVPLCFVYNRWTYRHFLPNPHGPACHSLANE